MDIKAKYESLAKKYCLPAFKEINNEFEISSIEDTDFLLRDIITKINGKIDIFLKVLDSVLQPETTSFSDLHECRLFDEEEKKNIFSLYKKLMIINRGSLELSLEPSEKKEAEFIKKTFNDWKRLKKELLEHIKRIKESWYNSTDVKEELSYFG